MLRAISLICISMLSFVSMAYSQEDRRINPMEYNVVSDQYDSSIPKGKYILTGTVKMFSSANPLEAALVGCTSSGMWIDTDSAGHFSIRLNATDTVVYIYKKGWSEVVIEDYDFQSQHRIEVEVYLNQNYGGGLKRKPVIYLYSDEEVDATIKLDPKGDFLFTYPVYSDHWEAKVSPNSGVIVDGKNYPYLFWEAQSEDMTFDFENNTLPGFLVESVEIIPFLEDKLSLLGFNETESTDFITYWGPLLGKKKYAFIQFLEGEAYQNEIAAIDIQPKPTSVKRVFIKCALLDQPEIGIQVVPQELESFDRTGFTLVEWGGAMLQLMPDVISYLHK